MWGRVRHVADEALPLPADERVERDQHEPTPIRTQRHGNGG